MSMNSLTKSEQKIIVVIAAIFALRLFGQFMILPVFAGFASTLLGAAPLWIGLALGAYGLTQGLLQLPFGMLSDKFGRKPLVLFGLGLLAVGSVIAAKTESIYLMILARAMQGGGAIGCVLMASLVDKVEQPRRAKATALVGMTIGLSFMLAMLFGPLVASFYGISSIFYLTAVLAILAFLLYSRVFAVSEVKQKMTSKELLIDTFKNRNLWPSYLGGFLLHGQFTALMLLLPNVLSKFDYTTKSLWMLYIPTLTFGGCISILMIWRWQNKSQLMKFAVGLLVASLFLMRYGPGSLNYLVIALLGIFSAFTTLESLLPAQVGKFISNKARGTAMGCYSSLQFLGTFVGAIASGWLIGSYSLNTCITICVILSVCWFLLLIFVERGLTWQEV